MKREPITFTDDGVPTLDTTSHVGHKVHIKKDKWKKLYSREERNGKIVASSSSDIDLWYCNDCSMFYQHTWTRPYRNLFKSEVKEYL